VGELRIIACFAGGRRKKEKKQWKMKNICLKHKHWLANRQGIKLFFIIAAWLLVACENREEPVQFAIAAAPNYSFSANPNAASFAIIGNISWQATLMNGGEWCSITPTSAHGDGTVEIFVAANTDYFQERTATIVVKAGIFSKEITVKQAPLPCPEFDAGAIATAGQTITIGGTPATINSVEDAAGVGVISYQWYKNDVAIGGATEAAYTPPQEDAAEAGTYTYTRQAKDNICSTSFIQSEGGWTLTVIDCNSFSAGVISSAGQTVCSGDAVNTITSSLDASGGYVTITYEWRRNSTAIEATNATTYNPSTYNTTVGTHTFTRWAKEDGVCVTDWTQSTGQWLLTVNDTPSLTLTSGNANQTKTQGEAITVIQYTTTNTISAYLSNGTLPAGVTGSWSSNTYTISGTISPSAAVQTYNYTVTTTNNNGCTNATTSGQIVVQESDIPISTGGPNTAFTTTTWIIGAQIWTDRIVASPSNCTQTNNLSTSSYISAEYKVYDGRYYYSWNCAYNNQDAFCPSPWRLPSQSDFSTLVSNTNYTTLIINAWGYGGYAYGSSMRDVSTHAYYWSSMEYFSTYPYYLYYYSGNMYMRYNKIREYGFQVRCVK
jgi:hypothetical protein